MTTSSEDNRVIPHLSSQRSSGTEEYFRWILDNARDLVIILNKEGKVLYINNTINDIIGYQPEAIIGKQVFALFDESKQKEMIIETFHQMLKNPNKEHFVEVKCLHKDGTTHILEAQGKAYLNNEGDKEIVVMSRDITSRKQTEQELDKSKKLFQSAFDFAPIGIAIVGLTGEFHEVNEALCQILGYSKEEVTSMSFEEITYPEDIEKSQKHLKSMSEGSIDSFKLDKRYIHKEGHIIWARLSVSLVRDKRGTPQFFVSQIEDITKRRGINDTLRQSEEKYRTLFENVLEGVYQVTDSGKLLTANPAMAKMLGYSSVEELLTLDRSHQLYLNPNDRNDWTGKIKKEGVLQNVELTLKRKDGTHIHVLDNARAVRGKDGELLYYEGTLTDISERKKVIQELKQNRANLRALIENTQDSIWSIDRNYCVVAINSTFQASFQLAHGRKAQHGVNILEIVDERTRQFWKDHYDRAFRGERFTINQHYKYSGISKDVEINFNPIISDNGQITGVAVFAHDITERKKATEALRQSEERYRLLIENAQIGIFSATTEGKIQDANPKLIEILGFPSHAAVRGLNVLAAPPFVSNGIAEDAERCLHQGESISNECRYSNAKGKDLFLHYSFSPIKNIDGEVIRMQALIQDVSERRKATDQLFESYKYLGIINRKLAILLSVGKEQSKKTQDEVLEFLLNSAKEISNAQTVLFYKYNQTLSQVQLLSSIGVGEEVTNIEEIFVDDCDQLQKILEEQNRVQAQDFGCAIGNVLKTQELQYTLGLPLVYNKKTYGLLLLGFKNQRELTTQELDFYEVFALQATNALINNVL